jgi:gliding motility associated protien GldN
MKTHKSIISFILLLSITFFEISAQDVTEESTVRDRAYDVERTVNRRVIPYEHLRESDVFYERRIWREINVNEKLNKPFIYPQGYFIEIILDAAYECVLQTYDMIDDEFKTPLSCENVKTIGNSVDTELVVDPVTLEESYEVVENLLNKDHVTKYRIKEDWIFDKQLSQLYVRILGIAPIMEKYDENGNYMADIVMFWTYYPDLRNLLVNEEVFNPYNDSQRLSWDDIFEMRLFASTITKENNVWDRRIQDYATGIDALLEHDRIRQEMFEKEHDLWSL